MFAKTWMIVLQGLYTMKKENVHELLDISNLIFAEYY